MDQSRTQSEPSLQPNASHMQGGEAAVGSSESSDAALVCLCYGCNFICYDESSLDRHMQVHFQDHFAPHRTMSPYTNNTYGATFKCYNPHSIAAPNHTGLLSPTTMSTTQNNTGNTPLTITGGAATSLNGRFNCSHVGCTLSFGRPGDLERHEKSHQAGPKDLDCPVRDCRRKGVDGFMRKDKLMDHLKAKHKW